MNIPFTKMQAQGNDFVIIDNRAGGLPAPEATWIRPLAERRFGVGCDQVLYLTAHDAAAARMLIFNNDGSMAANCGNGLRCVGRLLMDRLHTQRVQIALTERTVAVECADDGVCVHMGSAKIEQQTEAHTDVCLGNPHRVFFEATEQWPTDRNIEIITGRIEDHVWIDIIERGAGRTLACGSGACAVAAAIWQREHDVRPLVIDMPGGAVRVAGTTEALQLSGPVHYVFEGVCSLAQLLDASAERG